MFSPFHARCAWMNSRFWSFSCRSCAILEFLRDDLTEKREHREFACAEKKMEICNLFQMINHRLGESQFNNLLFFCSANISFDFSNILSVCLQMTGKFMRNPVSLIIDIIGRCERVDEKYGNFELITIRQLIFLQFPFKQAVKASKGETEKETLDFLCMKKFLSSVCSLRSVTISIWCQAARSIIKPNEVKEMCLLIFKRAWKIDEKILFEKFSQSLSVISSHRQQMMDQLKLERNSNHQLLIIRKSLS